MSGKSKPTQAREKQLASDIIEALKSWRSIGSIENWVEAGSNDYILKRTYEKNAPQEYQPNLYLDYRLSIRNKLWMDSIILTLQAKGKDGLAQELKQRCSKLIAGVSDVNKKLTKTDPLHLPNLQLVSFAARLEAALKKALPYLGENAASSKEGENKPDDLIDLYKAVSLYLRSRAQIKRDINDGKIKDYRKIPNGKHWISKKEADGLYIPK